MRGRGDGRQDGEDRPVDAVGHGGYSPNPPKAAIVVFSGIERRARPCAPPGPVHPMQMAHDLARRCPRLTGRAGGLGSVPGPRREPADDHRDAYLPA